MKNLGVQGVQGVREFGVWECYPPNGLVDLIDTKGRERNRRGIREGRRRRRL